jgi:hypothetical protein
MKYPGIMALFFEDILEIVLEEVLGVDTRTLHANGNENIFGEEIEALALAIKEQGRGTLHGHIQVWLKIFVHKYENLHDPSHRTSQCAEAEIVATID